MSLPIGGCLYVGPILYDSEGNVTPEILHYTDGTIYCDEQTVEEYENPLCVVNSQQLVFVTAFDADGDTLDFYWAGGVSGPIWTAVTTNSGEFQSSQVVLNRDALVNGETLLCRVSDESDSTKYEWTVVVL